MVKERATILTVDDEPAILDLLRSSLEAGGFRTLPAEDGVEALRIVEGELPDMVILDITMPRMDGFEVARRLREWSQIPIIMLSGLDSEEVKVRCLNLGADDYMCKPFGMKELLARVHSVLRRTEASDSTPAKSFFSYQNLRIDLTARRVTVDDLEVKLTPTEYGLLKELVLNANKVLTHSMLLGRIWGPEYGEEKEYLRVYVNRLRRQLEPNPEEPMYILTIPRVGYEFRMRC